jgi:hypothetical protein
MTALVERLFEDRTGELAEDFPDQGLRAQRPSEGPLVASGAVRARSCRDHVTPSRLRKTVIVALAVVPEECAGEA